jgi:hypothetical protein
MIPYPDIACHTDIYLIFFDACCAKRSQGEFIKHLGVSNFRSWSRRGRPRGDTFPRSGVSGTRMFASGGLPPGASGPAELVVLMRRCCRTRYMLDASGI